MQSWFSRSDAARCACSHLALETEAFEVLSSALCSSGTGASPTRAFEQVFVFWMLPQPTLYTSMASGIRESGSCSRRRSSEGETARIRSPWCLQAPHLLAFQFLQFPRPSTQIWNNSFAKGSWFFHQPAVHSYIPRSTRKLGPSTRRALRRPGSSQMPPD